MGETTGRKGRDLGDLCGRAEGYGYKKRFDCVSMVRDGLSGHALCLSSTVCPIFSVSSFHTLPWASDSHYHMLGV